MRTVIAREHQKNSFRRRVKSAIEARRRMVSVAALVNFSSSLMNIVIPWLNPRPRWQFRIRDLVFRMFVQHQHAVRRQIVRPGEGRAREEVVHRFVELDAHWRGLMVEQEENFPIVRLAHAHFHVVRHFEQRMETAQLPQPHGEVVVKVLLAHRADIDRLAESERVQRHRWFTRVKILRIRGENLAALRLDDVAPQPRGMQMRGWERTLEREMIVLARRQRIELQHFHAKQVGHVVRVTRVRCDVMFVHESRVERADESAAVLHEQFQPIRVAR